MTSPKDLLSPEPDGTHLKNGFSLGTEHDLPSVHASFLVVYHPRKLSSVINASIDFGDVHLDGGTIVPMDMTRLRQLYLSQLLSQDPLHCSLVAFQHPRLYNNRNVSRIGTLFANVSAAVTGDKNFDNFTIQMDTKSHPFAYSFITTFAAWVVNSMESGINSAAHATFSQAESYCTGGQTFGYDDSPPILNDGYRTEFLYPIIGIVAAIFVVLQSAVVFIRRSSNNPEVNIDVSRYEPPPCLPPSISMRLICMVRSH